MLMFLVTHNHLPPFVFKARTPEGAIERFRYGMSEDTAERYVNHESFKVRPLTLELLDEVSSEEFTILDDVSF